MKPLSCAFTGTLLFFGLPAFVQSQNEIRDEPGRLVLRNRQSTLVLDKEAKGAIVSLRDNAKERELIARDPHTSLFRLGFSRPDDTSGTLTWVTSDDAEEFASSTGKSGAREIARLTFRKLGGRQLEAECTVTVGPEDEMILWGFSLKGREPLILEEVHYPQTVLRVPAKEENPADAFVAGLYNGGVYPRPSRWRAGAGVESASQPGSLAAQFGCYYDPACGFFSATRDGAGHQKRLRFRRIASGLEFVWERYCYHDLSEPFDLGYEIAQSSFHAGDAAQSTDWRHAADLYKSWALRQPWCAHRLTQRDDLPEWLKEGPAMVKFRRRHTYYQPNVRLEYHRDWYSEPEHMETWLNDYWNEQFPGVPLIVAFWGWEHLSSWISPKYFPPYPSEEGLRDRIEAVRKVGGHPFFWPSGYHWAATFGQGDNGTFAWDDRERFESAGRPHAVITRDGSPFERRDFWLAGGTNRVLCRGDAWTRQWLNDTAVELTRRGADLIQIDQVTHGCKPRERGCCFSSHHGHPPGPGSWFVGSFSEQLRTMAETTRRVNPGMILGFEGAQEFYLQEIGIQDYRDFEVLWQTGQPERTPAPVFAYLYHEFVPMFQSNPEGFRGKPPGGNMLMMAYCLINGQMPHLVPHWPLEPASALQNGGFEQWTGGVPDGWKTGENSPGLCSADEAIEHGGKSCLRIESGRADGLTSLSQSIGVGELERGAGNHGVDVGKSYRLSLWSKGSAAKLEIDALNPNGEITGNWRAPLSGGGNWERAEAGFTVPERTARLLVTFQMPGVGKAWVDDVLLEEKAEDGTWSQAMQQPILPAEHRLAWQWVPLFHGEGRPYLLFGRMLHPPRLVTEKWKHTATQAVNARMPLHLYGSGGQVVHTAPVDFSGDTDWVRKEVDFTVPESAERGTIHLFLRIKGEFWFDDISVTDSESGRELVKNGGFEKWENAMKTPAGWTAAETWGSMPCKGSFHRDENQKHGGNFSLRLVNDTDDVVHVSQTLPVDGQTIEKGKSYRLSLWMRVEETGRVEREMPVILHNAFRAPDGSEAVVAVNVTARSQTGRLFWKGKEMDLELAPWEVRLIRE